MDLNDKGNLNWIYVIVKDLNQVFSVKMGNLFEVGK